VVLVVTGHALAAAWTWRDIRQQSAQRILAALSVAAIACIPRTAGK
jgi:hypothetical protein